MDDHCPLDCWQSVTRQVGRALNRAFWAVLWTALLASLLSNPIFWLVGLDTRADGALRIMGALCLMSLSAGVIGWIQGRHGSR